MGETPATTAPPAGVNLVGYLDATLGLAAAARGVRAALQATGVAVAPVRLASRSAPSPDPGGSPSATDAPHPVTIVCANPDGMAGARDEAPAAFTGRHVIGLWWWEVAAVPQRWLRAFDLVDEVWAGSRFVADVLAAVSPVPVVRVPLPVPMPRVAPLDRAALGLPADRFLLGFALDYASVAARKNPLGLIDAFTRAFAPGSGAGLVVKTLGSERHPDRHAEVLAAAAAHPDVLVVDGHLPSDDQHALIAALDGYVSLHRSEGFGLTVAEAMLLGVPVIATGYGGVTDFLTPFNSRMVDHRPVAIGPGHDPYPPGGEWAEPDLDHAAALMRELREQPEAARARSARARADVIAAHAPEVAGRAMSQRLARVLLLPHGRNGHPAEALDLGGVLERLAATPDLDSARNTAGARGALRRSVLRLIRPHTIHQRLVDEELVRALSTLDERVRGIAAGQGAIAAELARRRGTGEDRGG